MIDYKDIGWWYWLVTVFFLMLGLAGDPTWFVMAIGFTGFQLMHYIFKERKFSAFPVQVRFGYLILLMVSFFDVMQWLYWLPVIGTWAQIIFGYCAMARVVSLLPWNHNEQFSLHFVKKTLLSRPVRGSVQQTFPR